MIYTKLETLKLYGTTAGDGTLTVNASDSILGELVAVQWIDGTFADGVDAVISCVGADLTVTLVTLTNADNDAMYYPLHVAQDNAGANLTGVYAKPILNGKPRLAVTSGGDTRAGGCILYFKRY